MRTTITLEDDVAKALSRITKEEDVSAKEIINNALREYMTRRAAPAVKKQNFRTATVDLGACLVGSLDDVGEALSLGEGDAFK